LHLTTSTRITPALKQKNAVSIMLFISLIILFLTGCASSTASGAASVTLTPAPVMVTSWPPSTSTPIPHPTVTTLAPEPTTTRPPELKLWINPLIPVAVLDSLTLPAAVQRVRERGDATLYLEPASQPAAAIAGQSQWIYALVAPFPTTTDGVSTPTLRRAWQGKFPDPFKDSPLIMTSETLALLETAWGKPASGSVRVIDSALLLEAAWQNIPSWAIVPFDSIEPRWKVLRVDGVSPLDKDFDAGDYALSISFQISGQVESVQALKEQAGGELQLATNRDSQKLTVVVMTGVTALSRHTAVTMEKQGITYPGRDIRGWLSSADLTHISNEVSFADDCPPGRPDTRFCSPTRYIGLLEDVGTDIVELTGNHNLDWGPAAYLHTLSMYQERGWLYYGGGTTPEAARQPALIEHNGNRLAFLGCNASGPEGAWANEYQPGAATCDFDAMEQQIKSLVQQGYLPIVTLQHIETDNYRPEIAQRMPDFRRLAQAGAVIVSGSQSHYPQTITFVGKNFVHYGLGNLFFDQMDLLATRQEFIDRHVFYNGRYLGVELLTALLEDSARPRPMTTQERAEFLEKIFGLCVWKND